MSVNASAKGEFSRHRPARLLPQVWWRALHQVGEVEHAHVLDGGCGREAAERLPLLAQQLHVARRDARQSSQTAGETYQLRCDARTDHSRHIGCHCVHAALDKGQDRLILLGKLRGLVARFADALQILRRQRGAAGGGPRDGDHHDLTWRQQVGQVHQRHIHLIPDPSHNAQVIQLHGDHVFQLGKLLSVNVGHKLVDGRQLILDLHQELVGRHNQRVHRVSFKQPPSRNMGPSCILFQGLSDPRNVPLVTLCAPKAGDGADGRFGICGARLLLHIHSSTPRRRASTVLFTPRSSAGGFSSCGTAHRRRTRPNLLLLFLLLLFQLFQIFQQ
mmetsp:Transcript_22864/g.73591  ORF Transcript_22864/g.73591 Transcript_22864/m.73591 type:complete len:331 (+) Transcript_22864:579-1571(+)